MDTILNVSHRLSRRCSLIYAIDSISNSEFEPLFKKGLTLLPPEFAHRIERIRSADDAMRACFGGLLSRLVIAESIGIPWHTVTFREGSHGKPLYAGDESIWFNITHSGDWVGCAVAHRPIGLDIQRIRSVHPALPRRVLSPTEQEYLMHSPDVDRSSTFIRLWCLKESFLKAIGSGLATQWRGISIIIDGKGPLLETPMLPFPVRFIELKTGSDYRGAVCMFGDIETTELILISPEDLRIKLDIIATPH